MATTRQPKPKAVPSARKTTRDYIVVRVEGDTLTVLDPQRPAKNQKDAMDAVSANIPAAQRNGVLGAFLAASYREQEVATTQEYVTSSKERTPQFVRAKAPVVEPADRPEG